MKKTLKVIGATTAVVVGAGVAYGYFLGRKGEKDLSSLDDLFQEPEDEASEIEIAIDNIDTDKE